MALYDLKKHMKKSRKTKSTNPKTKSTNPKIAMKPKSITHKKIERKFRFEDARKFPLQGNVVYIPNYILTQTRHGKKIIIQVDVGMVDSNVSIYRMFMKSFKNTYYMIMVVSDGQLRAWNERDKNRHILFDEIWTVDNVDDMIESITNLRSIESSSDLAVCSICHRQAKGIKRIKNNFAYRTRSNGSLTIHPYCRKCQEMRPREVALMPESATRCIGCGVLFRTKIASQIYCGPCENSLTS